MKRTQKLVLATEVLADERYGDCSPEDISDYASREQIYGLMARLGYRWYPHRQRWLQPMPAWLCIIRDGWKGG